MMYVEELLPGVYALPHATVDTAHLIVADEVVLVGVPRNDKTLVELARRKTRRVDYFVVTDRCEDVAAQLTWLSAFPEARRVVHRLDAGRGRVRDNEKDWLLSTGNAATGRAKLDFSEDDLDLETDRVVDDGPWSLNANLTLFWAPGPTQGSLVVHHRELDVLFAGRLCGFGDDGYLLPFAQEDDHSVLDHVASLRSLADQVPDFLWLLPARGDPVRFPDTADARDGLRNAARVAQIFLGLADQQQQQQQRS